MTSSLREAIERQLAGSAQAVEPDPGEARPPRRAESVGHESPPEPSPVVEPGAMTSDAAIEANAAPRHGPDGIYVYGVVWAPDSPLTEELTGVELGSSVTTLIEGPLAAVISHVPLAEFEEEELRNRLSDIEWVEHVARAHESVLDDLCARTVVIPMRMCTIYRTEDNLRSMLRREEVNFRSALEFLDGKLEWGVKVMAHGPSHGVAPDATAAADDARAASSGTDYLSRRRARRDQQDEQEAAQAEAAAEIHELLGSLAHDGLLNPTQSNDVPGQNGRVVMNGAYLVEREATEAFHHEVQGLAERFAELGLELVPSGPWPPYNFVPGDVGAAW